MTAELADGARQDWAERFRSTDGDCSEWADEPNDDVEWDAWLDAIPQERYFGSLGKHGFQLA